MTDWLVQTEPPADGQNGSRVVTTPMRGAPFAVGDIDSSGVVLLFGKGGHRTPMPWECLEGVVPFLRGRDWVKIGGKYDTSAERGTFDEYLKGFVNRATAGWVAALLEKAGVVEVARTRPATVRLAKSPVKDEV